jgi:hypothetical protein
MTVAPVTVTPDSRLSHDVLLVAPLQVDLDALAGVAVDVGDDGTLVLLSVLAERGAVELRPSTTSASGYDAVSLPGGATAGEVVAAVDIHGTCHAFYATSDAVLHSEREPDGEWSPADSLPAATGLAPATVPLTGDVVVSGVDPRGQLMLYTSGGAGWSGAPVDVGGVLGGGGARLQYTAPDAWVLFGAADGALHIWQGRGTKVASGPQRVTVTNPVERVLFTYPHANSAMVMFTDSERGLYSSVGFSDKPYPVPLSNVARGAAAIGDDGLVRFYGADPDGTLWVLRQTGWDLDDGPVWAPIFPFDRDVTFVTAPLAPTGTGALAAVRVDGTLDLIRQSESTGLWRRTAVQEGAAEAPVQTTRYRTLLSVTDESGVPSPGTEVTITPSELVALEVGGRTVIASPNAPAVVKSEVTGGVEFTQPAAALDSVTFSVMAAGAPTPVPVTPHAYVHSMLAGDQPIFTGATNLPPLSPESLQAATLGGHPLAPGLTP